MEDSLWLTHFTVYLLAMVIIVPVCKRLGLGVVMGYLLAGVITGPKVLGLVGGEGDRAVHLAEFGVTMMLLLIGMELNPRLLWKRRGQIFGLGAAQVGSTSALFAAFAFLAGLPWPSSIAIGLLLSASSTAIVLQTLQERGYAKSDAGEGAFAILLFQDMTVIPILALFPLLGTLLTGDVVLASHAQDRSPWVEALFVIAAVLLVVGAGRFLVKPLFTFFAQLKIREAFTAMALLIVAGTTLLMHRVGLSPALGAFLAGIVLADSEYRHQIEADIEPFKGLLLGLFFISIGAGIDVAVPMARPLEVLAVVILLVAVKGAVVFGLGRLFSFGTSDSFLLGASLAQGGEFAFVLLSLAGEKGLVSNELRQLLSTAVALSMALAPLLIGAAIRFGLPHLVGRAEKRAADTIDEGPNRVIVIGIGRFGQVVVRLLNANGVRATVLDYDAEQIEVMARFGIKTYFGDGSSLDLLRSAGIEQAEILVLALDDKETCLRIVEEVKRHFPKVKIYARAFDRVHAYKLIHLGADEFVIETGASAVNLGTNILRGLGFSAHRAFRQGQMFGTYNERSVRDLAARYHETDRDTFVKEAKVKLGALSELLRADRKEWAGQTDEAWESAPRSET